MPSSPFASGPCDLFVACRSQLQPVYVGASDKGPRIQWRRDENEFYVDLGGSKGFDSIYGGTDALITIDLIRFDWDVLQLMENVPNPVAGLNPWIDAPGDIGSMNMVEGLGLTIWVRFNYAIKPPFAAAGMPRGLRFPVCKLMNENWDNLAPLEAVKIPLVIHAQRLFDPTFISLDGYGAGSWLLADNDMSAIAGLNIT